MKSKFIYSIILSFTVLCLLTSCSSENHFLKDKSYRDTVHEQFLKRKELVANRSDELFAVFDKPDLTTEEKEALEFLYAYMPLSDLADYNGDFFLQQVRSAFEAKQYFDWGQKIPDDVFRHFVLVYRVNNENLDSARQVFFEELKDRVKGMTMEEAVLEVNHWCHEKVTYRGTDGRTSSPLALVNTSWGRCGEQSTFTTVALRAIGIPARQCYTPRWAHTDDNHAWVEAWIDGEWHYIGACEPEAELDVAWFTAPAKRAMMVHTNVFGLYNGTEEKNVDNDLYSVINLLGNYTDTRNVKVKVVDEQGKPIEDATVKFKVYNYAEFYPIATINSNKNGEASIISGKGDLLVWANKGDVYGYGKSEPNSEEITITLNQKAGKDMEEIIVITPPSEQAIKELSPEKIAENAKRLAREDSIRNAYMATFVSEKDARQFASSNNLDAQKSWDILSKSQGNWREIESFMTKYKSNPYLFAYLESLRDKDLRDTPSDYLSDHLSVSDGAESNKSVYDIDYANYVLSPRIALELIRPWRSFFNEKLDASFKTKGQANINEIISFVKDSIQIDNNGNYYRCPISPRGVYEMRISDKPSRDIFFVALSRTLGHQARLEPSTSRPQYKDNGVWKDVMFEAESPALPKASVVFSSAKDNVVKPGYSTHYTLARYVDGDFVTLDFESDKALKELPGQVTVDAGYYRLMVGSRANDGSVTISTKYFTIAENETKNLEISVPKNEGRIQVLGIVDMNTNIVLQDGTKTTLKDLSNGKGMIVCFADPDKEPTKHILQDLPAVQKSLEDWGGGILFAVPDDKLSSAFDASVFKNLPKQSVWSVDNNRTFLNTVANTLKMDFSNNFPLTVYMTSNGGVLYVSQGYRIGIGENIIKTIDAEKQTKEDGCSVASCK